MVNSIERGNKATSLYGSKGQVWSEKFIRYMETIVNHPNYQGMPDAIKNDGRIQWEAPSNRSSGLYQFTHNKRRDWWRDKAKSVGIDTSKDKWISRTAKLIHPTGEKPCKRCGKVMQIGYVYPNKTLINRIRKYIDPDFDVALDVPIHEVIQSIFESSPMELISSLESIFKVKGLQIPYFNPNNVDIDEILEWLDSSYIPNEPATLSPGAMSNAPDRFDGFHSFNRCCRAVADKGRSTENLSSYSTDRRVFEYWSEGNWIATDRLMGQVRTALRHEATADGGSGTPSPDHIGPISLGFCHRPEFKLLSREANSAKNNRMTMEDVKYLISQESKGIVVTSWYALPLWNLRKKDVDNNEKALRLSKMMRDNQRQAMKILCTIFENEMYSFLIYLLELKYADFSYDFENLRAENFITKFDRLIAKPRKTKYSTEQKARRIRVGLESLESYIQKENRHFIEISNSLIDNHVNNALKTITAASKTKEIVNLNNDIKQILYSGSGIDYEDLKKYASSYPTGSIPAFDAAKASLSIAMANVAKELSLLWEDDRYVRSRFDDG